MKLQRCPAPSRGFYVSHPDTAGIDADAVLIGEEGSNHLQIGPEHYLNRDEVQEFVSHLIRWLQSGSLEPDP